MPKLKDDIAKLYYSIGEVSEMFKVSKSLIRFWESEFDLLRPHKNSKGDRRFTKQNIEQFRTIYQLVKERGFTLEGAKRELKQNKVRLQQKQKMMEKLGKLRAWLKDLEDKV
ncbi:MAG: MerR family transcriptional regulator [Bacteroidota bacterium]